MARLKVAALISGRGSNLQALLDACAARDFPAEIVLVVSNNAEAYGLERARQAGVATVVIGHRGRSREVFEAELETVLRASGAELICLAGFMRLLTPAFVTRWTDRILNIHPSLLPAFKGLHVHEQALAAGVRFTGCTVHFVRPEMDAGPILVQAAVAVEPGDTPDSLAARVLVAEHRIYPLALRLVADGRARVDGDLVRLHDAAAPESFLANPVA